MSRRLLILWISRLSGFAEAIVAGARIANYQGTGDHRSANQGTVDERTCHNLVCQAECF